MLRLNPPSSSRPHRPLGIRAPQFQDRASRRDVKAALTFLLRGGGRRASACCGVSPARILPPDGQAMRLAWEGALIELAYCKAATIPEPGATVRRHSGPYTASAGNPGEGETLSRGCDRSARRNRPALSLLPAPGESRQS